MLSKHQWIINKTIVVVNKVQYSIYYGLQFYYLSHTFLFIMTN